MGLGQEEELKCYTFCKDWDTIPASKGFQNVLLFSNETVQQERSQNDKALT